MPVLTTPADTLTATIDPEAAPARGLTPRPAPKSLTDTAGGTCAGDYAHRRCRMTKRTVTLKQPTRRNQVGTTPAARTATRLHREAAERETHSELVAAHAANLRARIDSAPLDAWRAWWRYWDLTAGPTAAAAILAWQAAAWLSAKTPLSGTPIGRLVAYSAFWTAILPFYALPTLAMCAVGFVVYDRTHTTRANARWLEDEGASVRNLFRPRFKTIGIEQLEHRRTDLGRTPPGTSVDQYQAQRPVIEDTLGHAVTIRQARPGVVAVTQIYRDLLADPVPWRPPLDVNPEALWLGNDQDGEDVTAPLTIAGSGLAWFLIGGPGSGKSALTNAVLAQIASMPLRMRRMWIIDPADGVDLGVWHPFAYRIADTPNAGIALLEKLLEDMEDRRKRMKDDGIDKCPPTGAYPWNVLVMDELPELTLNEDRKLAARANELIARIRRIGRKTDTSIVAISQDLTRDVVPRTMSKLFSHRACFAVSDYREVDVALPGARAAGYHPEKFDPTHPGRMIWWDQRTYCEARAVGLFGAERNQVVNALAQPLIVGRDVDMPPPSTNGNSTVPSPSRGTSPEPHADVTPQLSPPIENQGSDRPSPEDLVPMAAEIIRNAYPMGVTADSLRVKLDETESRIRTALGKLINRERTVELRSRAYFWIGPL